MHFISRLLHVCYFSILIRLVNCYLLFAANLDDFRAIAKKLEPEILGKSLARIAKPYLRENHGSDSEEVSSDIDNDSLPPIKGKEKHPPLKGKEKKNPEETFDLSQNTFDELVERVKQRLTMELKPTYLSTIRKENNDKIIKVNNHKKYNSKNVAPYNIKQNVKNLNKRIDLEEKSKYENDQSDFEEMSPFTETQSKVKQEIKAIKTTKEEDDYEEAMKPLEYSKSGQKGNKNLNPSVKYPRPPINQKGVEEIESTTDPSGLYEKFYFKQSDSYEDYVTPAKENIYASSENKQSYNRDENKHKNIQSDKRYKIETNHYFHEKFDKHATEKRREIEKSIKSPNNYYDYTEKNVESQEIKAKTENLRYDFDEKVTIDYAISQTSKKSKFGTKLPTRHTFGMATPNFMANFPLVVEKYNFDEPIPENDRERESLKYIGNPPASINKKVRLIQ